MAIIYFSFLLHILMQVFDVFVMQYFHQNQLKIIFIFSLQKILYPLSNSHHHQKNKTYPLKSIIFLILTYSITVIHSPLLLWTLRLTCTNSNPLIFISLTLHPHQLLPSRCFFWRRKLVSCQLLASHNSTILSHQQQIPYMTLT